MIVYGDVTPLNSMVEDMFEEIRTFQTLQKVLPHKCVQEEIFLSALP